MAFRGRLIPELVLNGENLAHLDPPNAQDKVYYGRHGGVTFPSRFPRVAEILM